MSKPNPSDNWRPGPEVERADSYEMAFCEDPKCGLHIIARRKNGSAICEIVMSATGTLTLVECCKDFLYDKAVRKDGK
jgi:hypothetical protein